MKRIGVLLLCLCLLLAGCGAKKVETISLVAGVQGQYGEPFTINKGTEFEENYFIYRVPAGAYTVTNVGKYLNQFTVLGETVYTTDAGWEELSDVYYAKALKPGESDTVTIEDGQIIEIHEPGEFELEKVKSGHGTEKTVKTVPPTTKVETTANPNTAIFEAAKTEIENRLGSNFCYYNVSYDDNMFCVSVSMEGIEEIVTQALEQGVSSDSKEWGSIRNSTITGYDLVKRILAEAGADLSDVQISFDLVSDVDNEVVYVSAVDGAIYYDVLEMAEEMKKAGVVETAPTPNEDADSLAIIVKGTMLKNHSDIDVAVEENTLVASFTYQGLGQVVPYLTADNKELVDNWENLITASEKECQSICDLVKACGYDYTVKMIILNDLDTTKSLMEFTDGKITYNVAGAE